MLAFIIKTQFILEPTMPGKVAIGKTKKLITTLNKTH
jgi:hypothetical protein